MPQAEPKRIVYLFGAGATHAELINLEPTAVEKQEEGGGEGTGARGAPVPVVGHYVKIARSVLLAGVTFE